MDDRLDATGLGLLAVGAVALLAAAPLLFTGNPGFLWYAVPLGLAGAAAAYLGADRLDRAGAKAE